MQMVLFLDEAQWQLLDNLAVATGEDAHANVLHKALLAYTAVVKADLAGNTLLLQRPNGDTEAFNIL